MAVIIGAYYFLPPENTQATEQEHATGRVTLVYRRNDSGKWKLLCDMDNMPPDVSPSMFTDSATQLYK